MTRTISMRSIKPYVRLAQKIGICKNCEYINVKAYENRLIYVMSGEGEIAVEKNKFPVSAGSVAIWQPGLLYSLLNYSDLPLELITVNFDYTCDAYNAVQLIPAKTGAFNPNLITELCVFSDFDILNSPVALNDVFFAEPYLSTVCIEFRNKKLFYEQSVSGIIMYLITEICRAATIKSIKAATAVNDIIDYIHGHYYEDLDNAVIGRIFNYHPNHINRLMLQSTGTTLHRYLIEVRIKKAVELIQNENTTVAEACVRSGFSDVAHFSKTFKRIVGKNPSDIEKIKYSNSIRHIMINGGK